MELVVGCYVHVNEAYCISLFVLHHCSNRCLFFKSFIINFDFVILDWQKTEHERHREQLLLEEMVILVDKRNELVEQLDAQERE